jgi:hypothetical protein
MAAVLRTAVLTTAALRAAATATVRFLTTGTTLLCGDSLMIMTREG